MNLKELARKLKAEIPAIFLALKDPKAPIVGKIFAAITVAYALSPIDLIPDFIPILGYLDDILLLPLLVALSVKCIPKDVLESCREQAVEMREDAAPRRWYYALPIVLIWSVVIGCVMKTVL